MRQKYIFLTILVVSSLSFGTNLAQAAESSATATETPTPSLYSQIEKAKEQLLPVKLNYQLTPHFKTTKAAARTKTVQKALSHYTLDAKDLALAIFDPTANTISTVLAIQTNTDFTFPPQYRDFDIEKVRFNGVNTRFKVNRPAGGKVLALKYLITPKESGGKTEIETAMYSGVYVPYSPELLDESVTLKGAEYINSAIAKAAKELANKPSVSTPGKTIPEVITPELVRAMVYAEHMDTGEFLTTRDTGELADKINVLLAGNRGDTWKYSVSTAGAAGIAQFIPSTYGSLVKRHKDISFTPDFVTGMRDHNNALKAAFVLLDDYIAEVKNRAPEHFIPGHAFDYGIAAYNGGPVRISRAAKQYGATWYEANFDKIAKLENQIAKGNSNLASIRAQFFSSKDKALKAKLQIQANNQRAELKQLTEKRDALQAGTLREETVHYVEKIHRLIQHFNGTQNKIVANS